MALRSFPAPRLTTARLVALGAAGALLSACGPTPLPMPLTSGAQPQAAPAVQVPAATVQRGSIQQSVSYPGDVRSRSQINVLPKATGRVQTVAVDIGSQVHAGDLLATLEADSPEIQVLQARANLSAAEAKLATVQAGAKPDDVSQADEALAQQQARLAAMQAQGRTEDVAGAQAGLAAQQAKLRAMQQGGRAEAVAQAQAQLDAATQKLALLAKGATDDVRQASVSAVNADKAQVAALEASYAAFGGNASADLQAAQAQVATTNAQAAGVQSVVAAANAALASLKGTSAADLQAAQSAYDTAVAQRTAADAALTQQRNPTDAQVRQAEAAVAAATAQRQQGEVQQTNLEQRIQPPCSPMEDQAGSMLSGRVIVIQPNGTACDEAKAGAQASIEAGNAAIAAAQAQLDLLRAGGSQASKAQAQAQLTTADQQVRIAEARLNALRSGQIEAQRAQIQAQKDQAQAQLAGAQEAARTAQARLDALRNGTQDAQLKATAAQLEAARQKLTADQAHLEQLVAGPQDEEIQAAQDAVDQAQAAVAIAQQPATEQDIAAQQALVEQARQGMLKARQPFTAYDIAQQEHVVAQAEAALRARQNPYTDQDVAAAQAAVDQAEAALELAQLGVKETRVVAPVDGIVFDRQVSPGALVSPQTPIVTLIPPSLDVTVNVDEAQLGHVQVGQSVRLSVPAYPDQTFEGRVSAVAPAVDPKSRTASVHVEPSGDDGKLKPGMMATVAIVVGQKDGALLVPRESVLGQVAPGAPATVVTLDGDRAQRRSVTIGLVSDAQAEVASGNLSEGEAVAVGNAAGLSDGDVVAPQFRTARDQNRAGL